MANCFLNLTTPSPEMGSHTSIQAKDVELSNRDFSRISKLVHDIAGIVLVEAKRPLVHSRLMRRLRALGLPDFASYADFICGSGSDDERRELISAVTTNVTAFYREQHHFDKLAQTILPPLIARAKSGGRVRIWSAGCSSGEEPYSIAATVLAAFSDARRHDVRILATDIDQRMVGRTRQAEYPIEAGAELAHERARLLFADPRARDGLRISPAARELVICNALNLQDTWPMKGQFDVIFCRNVVIYFDKATQESLWQRFALALSPGGYLMIGHSERVTGPALSDFEVDGITTYKRR
ncbi:MAG: CheR family methyltransferase [Paracoccaceae bacterium]